MAGWSSEFILPAVSAALAGGLIGLEREYRGHPAGLRTHILVCLSSALLMSAATHQLAWLALDLPTDVIRIDPVRMAHGILTGIGFLCGGVIFRQGLSVHGLTTAASLWMVSALGILYGVGFYGLAVGGTAATMLILVGLRWVDQHLPHSGVVDVRVRFRREGQLPEAAFHSLMEGLDLKPGKVSRRLVPAGDAVEFGAILRGPDASQTHELAERFCADARVVSFEIQPRDD
ncbi:MAG: MgtC/SapB family protein [Phenylobacterium sp.]|uniref:MgtC/SapB family protein n=1 Tax=Phenylobacterium sp. TaxID=1871053 RepID=UPI0025D3F3EB|nr:MgtC/SapB family protein [Phenylobacterium sp.]MBI1197684.1 MgtC/SapB family protein [Phenylobacterium sp.]